MLKKFYVFLSLWSYNTNIEFCIIYLKTWILILCGSTYYHTFSRPFNWILISQLIKGISSVLQKFLIFFNGTIILTSFMPPFPTCPVIFCLNLNEVLLLLSLGKSIILSLFSKLVHLYTQLVCNIPGIFAECSLSVAMLGTSKEHLGNILKDKSF